MRDLQQLIILLILSILGLFSFMIFSFNDASSNSPKNKTPLFGCGTSSIYNYSEEAVRGKALFKQNCAMCHNKNMVSWATGPPLASTIKKWNNDTLSYQSYLKNSLAYRELPNGTRKDSLLILYNTIAIQHKFNLSFQEVQDLIAFIEM